LIFGVAGGLLAAPTGCAVRTKISRSAMPSSLGGWHRGVYRFIAKKVEKGERAWYNQFRTKLEQGEALMDFHISGGHLVQLACIIGGIICLSATALSMSKASTAPNTPDTAKKTVLVGILALSIAFVFILMECSNA